MKTLQIFAAPNLKPYLLTSAFVALLISVANVTSPATAHAKTLALADMAGAQDDVQTTAQSVDLLAYLRAHIVPPPDDSQTAFPKYNRKVHFGTWMHQDDSRPCTNTREMALVRDSDTTVEIQYTNDRKCTVESGLWHDPYTGADFERATDMQIDHVVPLKHAYNSGAYAWRPAVRCHYANFLANGFHLQSVNGHENMAKGDRSPDGYMPPNAAYRCQYVSDWMKIKVIWQLTATQDEVKAIENVLNGDHCHSSFRVIEADQLNRQRDAAAKPISVCERFEKEGGNFNGWSNGSPSPSTETSSHTSSGPSASSSASFSGGAGKLAR